jgi:hypothetical protein
VPFQPPAVYVCVLPAKVCVSAEGDMPYCTVLVLVLSPVTHITTTRGVYSLSKERCTICGEVPARKSG